MSVADVLAGSYCAVESVVVVNGLSFHLRWLRETARGTDWGCRDWSWRYRGSRPLSVVIDVARWVVRSTSWPEFSVPGNGCGSTVLAMGSFAVGGVGVRLGLANLGRVERL
jgi:hypothetical protein